MSWMGKWCRPGWRGRCGSGNGIQRRGGLTALRGRSGCGAKRRLRWGHGALTSLGASARSRRCGRAQRIAAIRTGTRPRGCKHARSAVVIRADRSVAAGERPSRGHCGRGGRCWCNRRAGPRGPRRGRRGIVSRGGFVSQPSACAAASIVGVVVAITSTISTTCAVRAVGVAIRSSSAGDAAWVAFVAAVTGMTRRFVRFHVGGGAALGVKLMSCDVVLADFDTGSGP